MIPTPRPRRRARWALTVAAAAAAVALPLTACSGTPASNDKTLTVMINAGHDYKAYEAVFSSFEKSHNVKINVQKYQWDDLQTKLTAGFRSGDVPDLVEEAGPGISVQYGVQGNVKALNQYIDKDGSSIGFPSDFQTAAVNARVYKGKYYAVPFHLSALGLLFYNKDMLRAAGYDKPPTTWAQLMDVAKATTKNGVYGLAINGDPTFDSFLVQSGAAETNAAKNQVMQPSKDADKALQFIQDAIYKDKVAQAPTASSDYSGPQKLFSSGRAAMFISGPWDFLPVKEGSPGINWGVAEPLTGTVKASVLSGTGLMIPSKAKNPDLAWDLIKELTSLKVELAATKESGISMPRKSWAASPAVVSDPDMKAVAESLSVAVAPDPSLYATGKSAQVDQLYLSTYQKIVIQQAPVEATLDQFRSQVKELLK